MASKDIYIKAENNVELTEENVYVKDVAQIYCSNQTVQDKVNAIKVYKFKKDGKKRQVLSVLRIIQMIEQTVPAASVQNIGEKETIIELVNPKKHQDKVQFPKVAAVSLISFFGTAFTIMAFHNDIGISRVFTKFYMMVLGSQSEGCSVLEISYSIGLTLGIMVFFNHVGRRRITKDPTPIEVEMRLYEENVNKTLVETADREGMMMDAQ